MAGLRGGLGAMRRTGKSAQRGAVTGGRYSAGAMSVGDLSRIASPGTRGRYGRAPSDVGVGAPMGSIEDAGPSIDDATSDAMGESEEQTLEDQPGSTESRRFMGDEAGGESDVSASSHEGMSVGEFGAGLEATGLSYGEIGKAALGGYAAGKKGQAMTGLAAVSGFKSGAIGPSTAIGLASAAPAVGLVAGTYGLAKGLRGLESERDRRASAMLGYDVSSFGYADLSEMDARGLAPGDMSARADIADWGKEMSAELSALDVDPDVTRGLMSQAYDIQTEKEQALAAHRADMRAKASVLSEAEAEAGYGEGDFGGIGEAATGESAIGGAVGRGGIGTGGGLGLGGLGTDLGPDLGTDFGGIEGGARSGGGYGTGAGSRGLGIGDFDSSVGGPGIGAGDVGFGGDASRGGGWGGGDDGDSDGMGGSGGVY